MTQPLTRRSALRGAAAVVIGGIAGFAVARNSSAAKNKAGTTAANAYGAGNSSGQQRRLATVSTIPIGGGTILKNPAIVLVRPRANEVKAFSGICTHQGCPVNAIAKGTIDCPCHGSRFDVRTGAVVTGPASAPLAAIAVEVRNGQVYRS